MNGKLVSIFDDLRVIHRQREICPDSLWLNMNKEVQNRNENEPVEPRLLASIINEKLIRKESATQLDEKKNSR